MQVNNYYVKHLLKVKLFSLKSYADSLKKNKYVDFTKCKSRFVNDIKLMTKYLKDIEIYTYNSTYNMRTQLEGLLEAIKTVETIENLLEVLETYNGILSTNVDNELSGNSIRYVLEETYESGENRIGTDLISTICESIKADDHIKIFDPQCGDGTNVSNFARCIRNSVSEVYGLDEEQYGIYDAKKKIDKTIIGTLRGSKISNEVFDILFLKPRPQIELEHNFNQTIKEANEKAMLKQTYRFLKPGGLMVYTVPFYRMYNDMWYFIAKNFVEVMVIAHKDKTEKLITIYAIKRSNPYYADTLDRMLNIEFDSLRRYCDREYTVNANPELEVQLFRGSVIDVYELTDIIENDGLYNDFHKSFDEDKTKKDTSPLLPFNLGQIGLILTSGELDGIVEEIPGVNHVIKGMTVKTVNSEEIRDSQTNTVTCKNTISNMVQLNAFTADGDFVSIN